MEAGCTGGLTEICMNVRSAAFLIILAAAAWQDLRFWGLSRSFLLEAGVAGGVTCFLSGTDWRTAVLSSTVGFLILLLCRVTEGGIGEGDGWFFVITGFFLEPGENIMLFLSGLLLGSVYGLVLTVRMFTGGKSSRGKRFPFLPYLLPMGLWLTLA